MELSTFALIVAVAEIVAGISFVVNSKRTANFLVQFLRNEQAMRMTGLVLVILCVLVLSDGYAVSMTAPGLLRLLAWVGLVKGLMYVWWPDTIADTAENFIDNASSRPILGIGAVAFGLLLVWASGLV